MKTTYKRFTLKGHVSQGAALQTLGHELGNGRVVRIHYEEGETHVYLESFETGTHGATAAEGQEKGGYTSEDVTLEDVTDLSPRKR
jgi:hypothetical protein